MKKITNLKFSLKFKILLGISFLLIVFTAVTLGYSSMLFIEDKTSYIFATGLKKAETISDQLNFKINDLESRLKLNDFLLNKPAINFEEFVNQQNEIVMFGGGDLKDGQFLITKQYHNAKNMDRLSQSFGIKTEDFTKIILSRAGKNATVFPKSRVIFFSPRPNLTFLIYLSVANNANFNFLISDCSTLFDIFQKDRSYTNKIISLDNVEERKEYSDWLSKVDYKKSKKGVLDTTVKNKDILLSYVFVNENILILSSINKSDAFNMTRFLILKTILFSALLLGIAMVLGIFFSLSITSPIMKLIGYAKIIAAGDFSSTIDINTSDEVKILGETFNFMSSEIQSLLSNKEALIAKLEDYSKNLEVMVKQRTSELNEANTFMSSMVNSLDQGLLVFDAELKCLPMYTKACETIFEVSPLNKSITDVLGITEETKAQAIKQWATVVFNEMIPFESAIELGPKEKITGGTYIDPDFKYVQINYYPMRNVDKTIANIVMIATDKTNEIQAIQIAKEKEAYVSMILKILNNKSQFESFITEVEGIFEQFQDAFSIENKTVEFDLCMMLFHTLNGGFGIYSITKLQQISREYESEISKIKDSNPDPLEYIHILKSHVENLRICFLNFRSELDSLMGTKFASSQSVTEVPRTNILELKALMTKIEDKDILSYYNEYFVKTPISNYFNAYSDFCKTTAVNINKEFKGLTFHNSELKIEAEPLLEFFNVLVHLFRNCLDHGIEDSQTRQLNGKSLEGQIDVAFDLIRSQDGDLISVVVQDDGAGIDPAVIRSRYQKLNPEVDISFIDDRDIIYKIFDPFFSTRDNVSALSGRGVGMSAIKAVVDRLNGQIEIESHLGKGTIFSFLIPIG